MGVTNKDLDNWFAYHAPTDDQADRYQAIRSWGKAFSLMILEKTPACADQTVAIRCIREAVMNANAAIACNE